MKRLKAWGMKLTPPRRYNIVRILNPVRAAKIPTIPTAPAVIIRGTAEHDTDYIKNE